MQNIELKAKYKVQTFISTQKFTTFHQQQHTCQAIYEYSVEHRLLYFAYFHRKFPKSLAYFSMNFDEKYKQQF